MSASTTVLSRKTSQETMFADDISVPELRPITSDDLKHEKPATFRPSLDTPKRIPTIHPHVHPGVRTMILNPVKMSSIEITQIAQLPVATDVNAANAKFRNKVQGHYYTKTPYPSVSSRLSLAVSLPVVPYASADNRCHPFQHISFLSSFLFFDNSAISSRQFHLTRDSVHTKQSI